MAPKPVLKESTSPLAKGKIIPSQMCSSKQENHKIVFFNTHFTSDFLLILVLLILLSFLILHIFPSNKIEKHSAFKLYKFQNHSF